MTMDGHAISRYVVVALFDPITVGTSFSRKRWPPHVTLASNFVTEASVDELVRGVRRAEAHVSSVRVEFRGSAQFGPGRDVPVRLVAPGRVVDLHRHLADEFEQLTGFVADEPAYWREGYRPHLTLGPSISVEEGESRTVRGIAIARLNQDEATVVAVLEVLEEDPSVGVAAAPGVRG